jgi:hypothetical protein
MTHVRIKIGEQMQKLIRVVFFLSILWVDIPARGDCYSFYREATQNDWAFYAMAIFGRSPTGATLPLVEVKPGLKRTLRVMEEAEQEGMGTSLRSLYRALGGSAYGLLSELKATIHQANANESLCPEGRVFFYDELTDILKNGNIQKVRLHEIEGYPRSTTPPWAAGSHREIEITSFAE